MFAPQKLFILLQFGGVLENSNFILVFIFVLSFSIATICFSFLVSTFFSRANLAAACGGFFFFACFLPYNFLNLNDQDYSLSTLILVVNVLICKKNCWKYLCSSFCFPEFDEWRIFWHRLLLFCESRAKWRRCAMEQYS